MKIWFLGAGGAFNPHLTNSSLFIQHPQGNILLDCGYNVFQQLSKLNLCNEVDYVLISHLHNDHIGSLSTFIYFYTMIGRKLKLKLLYVDENQKGTLRSYLQFSIPLIDDFVDFIPLYTIKGIKAIDTLGLHVPNFQTYGFVFEQENHKYYFTGDLGDEQFLLKNFDLQVEDVIFYDTEFVDVPAHAYYQKLQHLYANYQIFGYHHDIAFKPQDFQLKSVHESEFLLLNKNQLDV